MSKKYNCFGCDHLLSVEHNGEFGKCDICGSPITVVISCGCGRRATYDVEE